MSIQALFLNNLSFWEQNIFRPFLGKPAHSSRLLPTISAILEMKGIVSQISFQMIGAVPPLPWIGLLIVHGCQFR